MKILGIIPAGHSSSRFKEKSLADVCGKSMTWWIYQQAKRKKFIGSKEF